MYVEVRHVNKSFGDFEASKDVSFGIERGKLVALLGPSGSGKTTILRMIAGLEHQDSGDILIDGTVVNDLAVAERGIGFVFQSYALFPYMTVRANVAYGLKNQKLTKAEISERVSEHLRLVGLEGLEERLPSELSGGQRQRVAFARALAPSPQLLLLDEPFAAIDAKIRQELRTWLRELISTIGVTCIFVTHDQDEAVEVADEIIVTNEGRVEQVGRPGQIYREPATPFVATFIGDSAIVTDYDRLLGFELLRSDGTVETPGPRQEGDDSLCRTAVIRPEFVDVRHADPDVPPEGARMRGVVTDRMFRGSAFELEIELSGVSAYNTSGGPARGMRLKTRVSPEETSIRVGSLVDVLVWRLHVIDGETVRPLANRHLEDKEGVYVI